MTLNEKVLFKLEKKRRFKLLNFQNIEADELRLQLEIANKNTEKVKRISH